MSNRIKKSKTDQLRAATGHQKGPHITKISAGSGRRPASERPDAELVITPTGQTELQPTDPSDPDLDAPETTTAKDSKDEKSSKSQKSPKKLTPAEKQAEKARKKAQKAQLRADKLTEEERPLSTYFLLARPFVALGRYLRDSWREIRQVRWPNRRATWKMTLAALVYVALFMVFLSLVDAFFAFIFDLLFK